MCSEGETGSELLVCKLATRPGADKITRPWTCARNAEQWPVVRTFPQGSCLQKQKYNKDDYHQPGISGRPALLFSLTRRSQTSDGSYLWGVGCKGEVCCRPWTWGYNHVGTDLLTGDARGDRGGDGRATARAPGAPRSPLASALAASAHHTVL